MKRLLLCAVLFIGCRKPDPELEKALDHLQDSYRASCVQQSIPPEMILPCTNIMHTLNSYGRL